MRVMHVHRIGGIGGSERHLLTLLPALAAKGVDVSFVGLDMPGADPFYDRARRAVRAAVAAVAAPRGRETSAAGSRAHASRARRRLRRGLDAHADRLDEAQPRPVSHRAVALRRARAGLARARGSSPSATPSVASASRRSGCPRTRSRSSTTGSTRCPSRGARIPSCPSPTTHRSCFVLHGSRLKRASTPRFARCRRSRTRRCSCSAKGRRERSSRRSRSSLAWPAASSCRAV